MLCATRIVSGCDWMCEPWVDFDGVLGKVTAAANGAPTGWLLNGTVVTRRMAEDCRKQTVTIVRDCNECKERRREEVRAARESCADGLVPPDAVVQIGSQQTSLGGSLPLLASSSRQPWHGHELTNASENGMDARRTFYRFACPGSDGFHATAVVSIHWRMVDSSAGMQQEILQKQVNVDRTCMGWFHVAVNVCAHL